MPIPIRVKKLAAVSAASSLLTFCGAAPATAATISASTAALTDAPKLCATASAVMQKFHSDFANGSPLSAAFATIEQTDLYEHPDEFVSFVLLTTPKIWLLRHVDYAKIRPVLYKQCLQHLNQTAT